MDGQCLAIGYLERGAGELGQISIKVGRYQELGDYIGYHLWNPSGSTLPDQDGNLEVVNLGSLNDDVR